MPKLLINVNVNGRPRELAVEPYWTLLEAVREGLGLTGSKEGCGTGDCGACSMILREPHDERGRLITSCVMLAAQADGREVITIEGVASNGELDAVQQAFIEAGGVQCGFCIPGMVMAAKNLLDHNPTPTEAEMREGLAGNLCRCTGYAKIYEAVRAVGRSGS